MKKIIAASAIIAGTAGLCACSGGDVIAPRTAAQILASDGFTQTTASQSSEAATILAEAALPAVDVSSVAVGTSSGNAGDTSGTSTYQWVAVLTPAGVADAGTPQFTAARKAAQAAGITLTLTGNVAKATGTGSAWDAASQASGNSAPASAPPATAPATMPSSAPATMPSSAPATAPASSAGPVTVPSSSASPVTAACQNMVPWTRAQLLSVERAYDADRQLGAYSLAGIVNTIDPRIPGPEVIAYITFAWVTPAPSQAVLRSELHASFGALGDRAWSDWQVCGSPR